MSIELHIGGIHIGTVIRSMPGTVYARSPAGDPIGTFGTVDAAVAWFMARREAA